MDIIVLVIEGILILLAIIIHQGKTYKKEKKNAASASFSWALILFAILAVANLIIGKGIPIDLSMLEAATLLAVLYLFFYFSEVRKYSVA